MAICEMHFWSPALQKQTAATVIVPEGTPGPWPVLYLLHGLSDDHTMWTRKTGLERYVAGLPLLVVMPDGGRGWYTDAVGLPRSQSESSITEDLIGFVDGTFRTDPARKGRALAGLSMGGYGAFKLALRRPDLFCAAASLSGAPHFGSRPLAELGDERVAEFVPVFGADPSGGPNDVYALARRADPAARPALRLDCGANDFLIEQNRDAHRRLTDMAVPHEYAEYPGAHDWAYWDRHVLDAIKFVCGVMGLPEFGPEEHLGIGPATRTGA